MSAPVSLAISTTEPGPVIDRQLFGHFAEHIGRCIYDGLWVGENSAVPNTRGWRNDLVAALKVIRIPNLRWPGGCYADDYHWRDGIGPREKRPRRVNAHWGGVVDDNAVGTHEFLDLCEQLGCEPYIAGNVGSGSPRELREWVEYLNASSGSLAELRAANGRRDPWRVRLFGVGNENWGCGGNMRVEYYADEYRRSASYVRSFPGAPLYRVAGGARNDDFHWTEVMMREAFTAPLGGPLLQGLSMHYYTIPGDWPPRYSATQFDEKDWGSVMAQAWRMNGIVRGHCDVMDRFDPEKKTALVVDEWGTWFACEPGTSPDFYFQQQTMRDALVASLTLNVFIDHCDRVRGANLAQVANVLQAVALTEEKHGRLVLTPTWDVFALYSPHQNARRLPVKNDSGTLKSEALAYPAVSATASLADDGTVTVTIGHTDYHESTEVTLSLAGRAPGNVTAQILTARELNACNTFDQPRTVTTRPFADVRVAADKLHLTLPPGSVISLRFS